MFKHIFVIYILLLNTVNAEPVRLESGINRNTLIELYTSEGCSSCPPADAYLNRLSHNPDLWKKWVPVAFHVNHWDYIGWKDTFATRAFGNRQSLYASLHRASTVYTPAFILNGSAWRPLPLADLSKQQTIKSGNLLVTVNDTSVIAKYQPVNNIDAELKLNVAILGMALSSYIERGENKGLHAQHEFVVIGFDFKVSNNYQWEMPLPELHYSTAHKKAIAIWVSETANPTPLQVVGGELTY